LNGDISWITPKDLSNFEGRYISKGEKYYKGLKFISKILPKYYSFSSRAPIGYVAIAKKKFH
jgi:type I restriction enzyme S subunit